jgi:hypothetical protein
MSCCDENISLKSVLVPVNILALTVFMFFSIQLYQVWHDRDTLLQNKGRQEAAFQESQKLQSQLSALVIGTQKLADQGDKNVEPILAKLKAAGVSINPNAAAEGPQPMGAISNGANPPVPAGPVPTGPRAPTPTAK